MINNYVQVPEQDDPIDASNIEVEPAPVESISQAFLRNYCAARDAAAEAQRKCDSLREDLLTRYHSGAAVERGAFSLTVKPVSRLMLTRNAVCAAFGEAEYKRLVARITPSVSEQVWVRPFFHAGDGVSGKLSPG